MPKEQPKLNLGNASCIVVRDKTISFFNSRYTTSDKCNRARKEISVYLLYVTYLLQTTRVLQKCTTDINTLAHRNLVAWQSMQVIQPDVF